MKLRQSSLTLFAFTLISSVSSQATITYSDRTSFETALSNTTVYDFESDALFEDVPGNNINYEFTDFDIQTSSISIYTSGIYEDMWWNGEASKGNSFAYVTTGISASVTITFDDPQSGIGFDWLAGSDGAGAVDTMTVQVDGITYTLGPEDSSGFWGIISEGDAISSIRFLQSSYDWLPAGIDNITYTAVPEPKAIGLALFIGTAVFLHRRRYKA